MSGGGANSSASYFDQMTTLGGAHKKFLLIATGAYFFDQLDLQIFGYVAPSVQATFGLSMEHLAWLNSLSFWGMFFGGLVGGWLADKIGRKMSLLSCIFIFSLSCLLSGWTNNLLIFEWTRFFTGFGVIGMVVIAMVYMAEMMPAASRGKYQSLSIACGTIGVPLGAVLARIIIPLGPETWRLVFYIGGAGIILIPLGWFWLQESPRWLITKGKLNEAEKIVELCTGQKADLSSQIEKCRSVDTAGLIETFKVITSKNYRKRSLAVFVLVVGVTLGLFYLGNWYTVLLTDYVGFTLTVALTISAIGVFGTPVGDFLSSFISDKGGRKLPIIICLMVVGVLTLAVGTFTSSSTFLTVLMFLKAIFSAASMTMLWTYLAESFPTRIRSSATGIMFSSARALAALSMATVPVVVGLYGYFGIHLVNSLFFFIPAIFAIFLGDKTGQKSLEELELDC